MSPDLEKSLYLDLAAFKRGDPHAAERAYKSLIMKPPQTLWRMTAALQSMLTLNHEDLQIVAAVKLAGLGRDAAHAVPDLERVALALTPPASLAAASALGWIPGDPSLEALVRIGERWAHTEEMRDEVVHHLLPAFSRHGQSVRPFLKKMQAAVAPCFSVDDRDAALAARDEMKRAYFVANLFNAWDRAEATLPASPALEKRGELVDPSPEKLPEKLGLVRRGSLRAILDDHVMNVAVEIHNPGPQVQIKKPVVVLSFDSLPFEWTCEETFVVLASLARDKFELPGDDTVWIDHVLEKSPRSPDGHPRTFCVDLVYLDDERIYALPLITQVQSVGSVLHSHGAP
jgi:hypothetical protein